MHSEESILKELVAMLTDMTSDWDMDDFSGDITGDTQLVADLAMESVELVQLMVAIEQRFKIKNFSAEKLLTRNGQMVKDLKVSEIASFLGGILKG
jgi:acyl carrier protein